MATSYAFVGEQQHMQVGGGERNAFVRYRREGEEVTQGLDADIRAKYDAKLAGASGLEAEACAYLSARTGTTIEAGTLTDALMDGTLLCELVNVISPGVVPKIHRSKIAMFQNENVTFFQQACRKLGVHESNLFALAALREGKDPLQVINCVLEVKRLDQKGLLQLGGTATAHSKWTIKDTAIRERRQGEAVVQGLDADIRAKYDAKLASAAGLEAEACAYLSARTGRDITPGRLIEALLDGTILCELANIIAQEDVVPKIHRSKVAMFHNENLSFFQKGFRLLGFPESLLFTTSDLREGKDPLQVIQCINEIR